MCFICVQLAIMFGGKAHILIEPIFRAGIRKMLPGDVTRSIQKTPIALSVTQKFVEGPRSAVSSRWHRLNE